MMDMEYAHFLFFTFGAMVGSFLNVLIIRLPQGEDFVLKSSHCPHCQNKIVWYENIPILSFIFLKRKCSHCHAPISWQYPIVELLMGIFSVSLSFLILEQGDVFSYFYSFFVISLLVVHFVIDIHHHLLLDSINVLLGILFATQVVHLNMSYTQALIGFFVGLLLPGLVTYFFYKLRGEIGLGGGDIKLFAVSGIYLGPMGVMELIFQSCALGAIYGIFHIYIAKKDKNTPFAFGPFIIIVLFLHLFFPINSIKILDF